jgi:hypothetical protein
MVSLSPFDRAQGDPAGFAFHLHGYHHRLAQTIDTPAWLSQFVEP